MSDGSLTPNSLVDQAFTGLTIVSGAVVTTLIARQEVT